MKAILVLDLPDDIDIDDVGITYIVQHWNGLLVKAQVEHIPLKPMPEKKEIDYETFEADDQKYAYEVGWNDCIDEILGEE